MSLFYIDKKLDVEITYKNFIDSLNSISIVYDTYKGNSILNFYQNLLLGIINNINITILDLDLLEDNVDYLQLQSNTHSVDKLFINEHNLITYLLNSESTITLFTSGTTGQPKSVTHTLKNIFREIRIGEKYKNDIWALAYNPTHIAGIQVFFQAIFNLNPIYYVFKKSIQEVEYTIIQKNVTHISASPTFYRLLFHSNIYPNVKRVSIGGEKSDQNLIDRVSQIFPNAKITNIYASTEAGTLFASDGEWFTIHKKRLEFIRIINFEIEVNKELLGFNSETVIEWYKTGDLVEFNPDDNSKFKIISRANELLNVGGNKINPSEIESKLLEIDGIKNAHVFGRKNSVLGFILCAKIVCSIEISDSQIRKYLAFVLPDYKIPRKIYRVDKIDLNKNGKLSRKLWQ